jgi:hypothetical protein
VGNVAWARALAVTTCSTDQNGLQAAQVQFPSAPLSRLRILHYINRNAAIAPAQRMQRACGIRRYEDPAQARPEAPAHPPCFPTQAKNFRRHSMIERWDHQQHILLFIKLMNSRGPFGYVDWCGFCAARPSAYGSQFRGGRQTNRLCSRRGGQIQVLKSCVPQFPSQGQASSSAPSSESSVAHQSAAGKVAQQVFAADQAFIWETHPVNPV